MNLHHLKLFRAVAAEGSLTGAARRLNLSQSALSTQIKALEASLGHDLFERRGRGLVLTEAGRIALDHADAIFRTADDLAAVMKETGRTRRALRVGALATLSRNFQIEFLRPLVVRKDVEVVLRSGSQAELLRELDSLALDVVLTNLAPPREVDNPRLVHQIGEQPVSLIGTPAARRRSAARGASAAREPGSAGAGHRPAVSLRCADGEAGVCSPHRGRGRRHGHVAASRA
jgi:LysR family transcriptional regulator, transcriptional activator of nhaA